MKPQPTAKQPITERKLSLPDEPAFNVRNLGSVRAGKFPKKSITLFCGPNNTSKTWTMYSLYRWHRLLRVRTKSERNGLHLFFRELSAKRTTLLHHACKEKIDINESLRDVICSRYAFPIARAYRKNEKFRDDLGKITSLQLPHRLDDDILRDGEVEENDKRQTKRVDFRKFKIRKSQEREPHFSAFDRLAFPFSNKERKTDGNVDLSMKDL